MAIRLGAVHLSVADLQRSLSYYERGLGMRVHSRENGAAALGADGPAGDLLVLHEQPGATPAGRTAGLFHFALLVSSRLELARSIRRSATNGLQLTGASDHFVSEAVYLRDPDDHGIEIYRDRPRDEWGVREDGGIRIGTIPLDLEGVMGELEGEAGATIDPDTVMGHMHLQASRLEPDRIFATEVLGLDVTASIPNQAEFLSWEGYHHHLGMNVWAGVGIPPAPPEAARLLHWTAHVPDPKAIADRAAEAGAPVEERPDGILVRNPSGTAVLLADAA